MPSPSNVVPDPRGDPHYSAILSHDARFDGRLFVGVRTTGVYCRPVCRVRTPLARNCRYFPTAMLAEQAGFRPCLRCRPELAPGLARVDSPNVLAAEAARLIDHAVGTGAKLPPGQLARRIGVTDRHLRRIFQEAHGVSPLAYLTTRRLLLAKQLLTDTAMPVTQVALASGFGSLRRFNDAFSQHYRLTPRALRRDRDLPAGSTVVRLAFRPPYDLAGMIRFLRRRALPGVERVDDIACARTLALSCGGRTHAGWLRLHAELERSEFVLEVSAGLLPALGALCWQVRQALDLDADPERIDQALAGMPCTPVPGVRLPGSFDGFETAVRIVLGQQVSVAAACTMAGRLVALLGQPLSTPWPGVDRLFPDAATVASADPAQLGQLGIVRQRVGALQALARAVAAGHIDLSPAAPLRPTLQALRELPGFGEWTVQLIAARVLGWPDAYPGTDLGLLDALGSRDPARAAGLAEAWRPWRAYALVRLWQTLEPLR
jgi:AraC family transcriptional regulator of adaptative response / DNA-3-methyladenine glycosylase II